MTQNTGPTPVEPADITWDSDGQPQSRTFDDIYFSRTDGLAESRYVFLDQNQLPQRFAQLKAETFCVGETGFGSGLNFLATWQLWRETAPTHARLHFVSVEKFPLRRADLKRALALWSELSPLAQALVEAYPPLVAPGFYRLAFDDGRVQLTLIVDEAATGLTQLQISDHPMLCNQGIKIDAWFLDGFAPAKNPEMWSDALFFAIGSLSGQGTTAATFSAAGTVKRGLRDVGFDVRKIPGFGRKREMLSAQWSGAAKAQPRESHRRGTPVPWAVARRRFPSIEERASTERQALVIGGGLAGCHAARALAERGFQVTLIDRRSTLASEGSGNPQALLYAKLSHQDSPLAAFNLASLVYAQRHYQSFWNQGTAFGQSSGVLQLAHTDKEQGLQQQLRRRFGDDQELMTFVDAKQASELAGITLSHPGLYFPKAGWLDPRRVCQALANHPRIHTITGRDVVNLSYSENTWQAWGKEEQLVAEGAIAVIASAHEAKRFSQTQSLPIKPIRGQITYLPANQQSRALKVALCAVGYLTPESQDQHCLGASFNLHSDDSSLSVEDHRTNLGNLAMLDLDLFPNEPVERLMGRVAFRCASRDYLPLVGPVPMHEQFLIDYATLRKDARTPISTAGQYWPGLYVNVGHGSRGLAYTPLSAQLLAAQISGEPLPLSRRLTEALNPARFVIRDLIRSKV